MSVCIILFDTVRSLTPNMPNTHIYSARKFNTTAPLEQFDVYTTILSWLFDVLFCSVCTPIDGFGNGVGGIFWTCHKNHDVMMSIHWIRCGYTLFLLQASIKKIEKNKKIRFVAHIGQLFDRPHQLYRTPHHRITMNLINCGRKGRTWEFAVFRPLFSFSFLIFVVSCPISRENKRFMASNYNTSHRYIQYHFTAILCRVSRAFHRRHNSEPKSAFHCIRIYRYTTYLQIYSSTSHIHITYWGFNLPITLLKCWLFPLQLNDSWSWSYTQRCEWQMV